MLTVNKGDLMESWNSKVRDGSQLLDTCVGG